MKPIIDRVGVKGIFELFSYKGGKPKVVKGEIVLDDKAVLVAYYKDNNKIMDIGKEALAAMIAGERPSARIDRLELGIGAYGIGNLVDPKVDPPVPADDETDLIIKTNPATVYMIDPEDNVLIPPDNPTSRVFTVVLTDLANNFDIATYEGYSEFALKMGEMTENNVTYPEVMFAKKHRKPILGDGETIYVVKWTIII